MVLWKTFNQSCLLSKKNNSDFNIENISKSENAKDVWNTFEIKHLCDICPV